MLSIGEFSKASGLTIKTLRFYHEQALLVPAVVDPQSGYRYYDAAQLDAAHAIAYLRSLEFPIEAIKEILARQSQGEDLLQLLERHRAELHGRIQKLKKAQRSLDQFISDERQGKAMTQGEFEVKEKMLDPMLIGGIRMKGRYSDCGKAFAKIGKSLGRYIAGSAFLLHYDSEYKEEDADFEACMPLKASKSVDGVNVRQLPGGRAMSLLHKGSYDQLGRSYATILTHIRQRGLKISMPTREVYLKGPGMIFKGNPKNYLTEIQIIVE